MIINFLNTLSPTLSRIFAFFALLLIPVLALIAIVMGTIQYAVEGAKVYFKDIHHMITREIPAAFRAILKIVKNGGRA
jgi:hypothetical protein